MFKSERSGELNGFLDAGSFLKGELRFEDTFRVDGHLEGDIESDGDLVIGSEGAVTGRIRVARVFVSGTIRGEIIASRRLEISERGRVFADVTTPALVIEEGAFLEGRCAMERAVTQGTVESAEGPVASGSSAASRPSAARRSEDEERKPKLVRGGAGKRP